MNQHVFKEENGKLKFVGDFDGLYATEENAWEQNGVTEGYREYYANSRQELVRTILQFKGNIAEVGCGLGYVVDFIAKRTGRDVIGYDISKVAISKAKKQFPYLFIKRNIIKDEVHNDIIVLNEMLWYILPHLNQVLDNCKCDYLIINQSYLKDQKYGKDIIDGFNGMLNVVSKKYPLVEEFYNYKSTPHNHGIGVFRVSNRAYRRNLRQK